jgi:hypothetical protein
VTKEISDVDSNLFTAFSRIQKLDPDKKSGQDKSKITKYLIEKTFEELKLPYRKVLNEEFSRLLKFARSLNTHQEIKAIYHQILIIVIALCINRIFETEYYEEMFGTFGIKYDYENFTISKFMKKLEELSQEKLIIIIKEISRRFFGA